LAILLNCSKRFFGIKFQKVYCGEKEIGLTKQNKTKTKPNKKPNKKLNKKLYA